MFVVSEYNFSVIITNLRTQTGKSRYGSNISGIEVLLQDFLLLELARFYFMAIGLIDGCSNHPVTPVGHIQPL